MFMCTMHSKCQCVLGFFVSPQVANKKTISQFVWPFIIWQLGYYCTNCVAWIPLETSVPKHFVFLNESSMLACKLCGLLPLSGI